MTVSLKHSKVTTKPDGVDNSLIQPSDWNADHVLTQDSNRLLGRTTAGVGATEEISVGSGLTLGSGSLSANVTSVAGRTGAVTLGVTDVSGAAPLASPALTGTPTAPTPAVGTNTTQVATTAYVQAEGYLKSATAASTYAPLASPALTGSPTAPTAATADNSTLIATTAFVKAQSYLTTTSAASTYAPLASPVLTGTPTAPTAAVNTNTGQVATTAFVLAQASNATPLMNGTAAVGTATLFAREDHVHPTDTTRAPLASPALTGTPTAPTAAVGTNTTQIATTAYVQAEGYLKTTTASTTYAPLASPALTGTPTAPTAAANTNTTQIATTAFVMGQGYLTASTAASTYAPINSPTFTGTVTIPAGASISGYLTTSAAAAGYVPQTAATGAATLPSGTSAQRPGSPAAGQVRYNTNTGKFEGYSTTWGNLGGGAAIGDTPPANPGAGDLWWDSDDGNLYVYYTDANSSQWVSVTVGGQGAYLPITGGSLSGDINFTGTGRRIGGDTINATVSNRLLWQDTGTDQPSAFGVIPNGTATSSFVQLFNSSTPDNSSILTLVSGPTRVGFTSTGIGTGSALPMIFSTAGTDRMTIDTSGNVGVGVTPSYRLHVTQTGSDYTAGFTNTGTAASDDCYVSIRTSTTGATASTSAIAFGDGDSLTSGTIRYAHNVDAMQFFTNGATERIRIDNSGNVGIGTTSPQNRLHISGASNGISGISIQSTGASGRRFTIYSDSAGGLGIFDDTAGGERARITSDGNLLVGTTGSSAGKITAISAGADSQNGVYGEANTKTASGSYGVHGRSNVSSTYSSGGVIGMSINANTYGISGYWSGSAYFSFYGNGNSFVSGTWQTSDARLKENVETIESALNTITALRPVAFDWKQNSDAARNGLSHDYGLIAQEVLPILPDIVQEIDAPLVSEDMTPSLNNELGSFYTIEYSRLIPHLIAAVQELKVELDAAKAEIAALKGAQ